MSLAIAACTSYLRPGQAVTTVSPSAAVVSADDIFELTFRPKKTYDNKFFDVGLEVIFTSPRGVRHPVKGFFYSTDFWKVRFRPDEVGHWSYGYTMTGKGGLRQQGDGVFDSTTSDAEGPVRRNPENPYRWVFANGKPYFPIGLQGCFGPKLSTRLIDGEMERGRGPTVSVREYFSVYGRAGFNLFRFSPDNCSFPLFDDLDRYREAESKATDELLSLARTHGFRVMFGFFGFYRKGQHTSDPSRYLKGDMGQVGESLATGDSTQEIVSKEKRFVDYAIARWGVYVDFWELVNEHHASDQWVTLLADYVRSVDPDRKPITTSWEKPFLKAIDINAPHWYESESELQSDLRVVQQAAKWKKAGKPVIVGEQGNTGMNWDPLSGQRMRVRTWTAFFQEITFVFWNTVWSKAGMHGGRYKPGHVANIYLGPEERSYIRVLHEFSSRLDPDVRMVPVQVSFPDRIRAYGLISTHVAGVYLHHYRDHTSAVHGTAITLDLPDAATLTTTLIGEWIEPSTGNVLARVPLPPGRRSLDVPPFTVDLALLVTATAAPGGSPSGKGGQD